MTAKQLKNSILQQAIQGKLIKQNKEDKPASELLKRIKAEREKLIKSGKIKINKNISAIYRKGNSFYEKIENEEICIDEELPFEIPKTWEWVRLGNFALNYDGKRKPVSVELRSKQAKIYDYYGATGVIDKVENYIFDGTFVLIGEDGGNFYSDKDVAFIVRGTFWANNHVHVLSVYSGIEDYFCYFLNSLNLPSMGLINGIAVPKLNQANLNKILIPLPPIEEQKRIVNKLNQLMPLIEEYEEKENKLNELDKKFPERLKKSILKEAFDGKLIKSSNKWRELTFSKCVNIIGVKHKIKRKNYLKYGKYPIIDQSQNFISGYSSNKNILINIKKPVIIFGDHNRYFKFVDFDFIAGADGIKILEPKEFFNEKLFYYFCLSLNIPSKGYSRHYKFLTKIKMRIPPIEEQKRIVEKLDKLINAYEELKKILFI
ncbi:restriction endonuclease subunit S [uncultured Brachyspira sp.]|uniref:restriction endonuclease subunit S n=1 Tax=uncultured Brachyspira sp. TaxID=221953 RepID=UPI00259BB0EB|nr:restriction endonuclease subunit S [uncultured Brachyspira sp.]